MEKLPNEIHHIICDSLADEFTGFSVFHRITDLKNLRLVNKHFAQIAARHIDFSQLDCYPHEDNIESITTLLQRSIHQHIKTIRFTSIYVPPYARIIRMRKHVPYEIRPSRERPDLAESYENAARAQKEIVAWATESKLVQTVLQSLPNLKELRIDSRASKHCPYWTGYDTKTEVSSDATDRMLQEAVLSSEELKALLEAVAASQVKLERLEMDRVHWELFRLEPAVVDRLLHPLTCLQSLSIRLTNIGLIDSPGDPTRPSWDHLGTCRNVLRTGAMAKALDKLTALKELDITFAFTSADNRVSFPVHLHDVIANNHWPHLESFSIHDVETGGRAILDFITRHSRTLKALGLSSVYLISPDSWRHLLPLLRNEHILNKSSALTDISVYGMLCTILRTPDRLAQIQSVLDRTLTEVLPDGGVDSLADHSEIWFAAHCFEDDDEDAEKSVALSEQILRMDNAEWWA